VLGCFLEEPGADRLTTSLELAHRAASLAADKLATDIVILDMRDVVSYTDYFVICSGRNPRQTQAIAAELRETLKRDRIGARNIDGERQGDWILLDYLDVLVHVFTPDARSFYRLESLWGEVPSESFAQGA
jgi:ribosome-associated protein